MKNHHKSKPDGIIRIDTYSKWFNVLMIGLCFLALLAVRLQVNSPVNGDEPHYLVMDYALVHNHNLDLKNIYANESYYSFFPNHGLGPQGKADIVAHDHGSVHSPHGVGLPAALYPGFLIAAKSGAVFELAMIATLTICLTWAWAKEITGNRKTAYGAAALLAICYFFNGLTGYIYPDMFIAAATLGVLLMITKGRYRKLGHQLLLGFLLGFLVLLHVKSLAIVAPALLVLIYKSWKDFRKLPWLVLLVALALIAYNFLTLHKWFGVWNIQDVWGADAHLGANPLNTVSAMLFDSARGLLVYQPILLLIFAGLPIWFRKRRESLAITLIIILPFMGVLALFSEWQGGASPPGRYIIDFLPALIPALAFFLAELRTIWRRLAVGVLAALTFLISLDAALMKFTVHYVNMTITPPPLFDQIQNHAGLALDKLLPSYSTMTALRGPHDSIKIVFWYCVLATLVVYGYRLSRPKKSTS